MFTRVRLFSAVFLLCVGGSLFLYTQDQQETNLIPRELIFGNPVKASPRLSPDGTLLGFLAPDSNNVLNVYIQKIGSKEAPQQVTDDKKRGIRSFMWQYDGQHILYTQDRDGDENWHLYQTDIATRSSRDLTPFENVHAGIDAYEPQFPDQMLITLNRRDPELMDVYRLDLATGELKLDTENPGGVFGWTADHQLQVRASQKYLQDGTMSISVRDTIDAPWRQILAIAPDETDGGVIGFTPDDKGLLLLSSVGNNTSRLVALDIATGKTTVLAEDARFDISGVMQHPVTDALEAYSVEAERYELRALDPDVAADFTFLSEALQAPFVVTSTDLQNQRWIVVVSTDLSPGRYYSYSRATRQIDFLFSSKPDLEKYQLSKMTPISFLAQDGMQLHGYLTLPVGSKPERLPTVLMVHGGPWSRDTWGFSPGVQWLANRGFAVLQVNFRGSTGYGKRYCNAGNREWGGRMHQDLLDGKSWLIEQGIADPARVAIFGGSYGGYATLAALAFTPDEFCCGVDVVGPSNLITLLETFPPYWSPLKARTDIRLGSLENDGEFLRERSPLFKAHQIKRPLLIAQGANDPRVKQAESDQIVAAMRKNKQPVEYMLFQDEGHGFSRPENRLKFYEAAEAFLQKYAKEK